MNEKCFSNFAIPLLSIKNSSICNKFRLTHTLLVKVDLFIFTILSNFHEHKKKKKKLRNVVRVYVDLDRKRFQIWIECDLEIANGRDP